MTAQRWNYKTHTYDPMELPTGCRLYSTNLSLEVACCECGKKKQFGEMFISKEVHNNIGLGYPVCEECFDLEIERSKEQ